jgi:hypothetical protein
MKQIRPFTNVACCFFVLVVIAIIFTGCMARELSVVGQWQGEGQSETLQFTGEGTFKGTFEHSLPSGANVDENPEPGDRVVDIGYQLIASYGTYPKASTTTATMENAEKKLQISYEPVEKELAMAWAEVLVRTEPSGTLAAFKEIEGRNIRGYRAEKPKLLKLIAALDGGAAQPLEWASLRIESIDLDLKWCGILALSGQYRYNPQTNVFQLYAPLASGKNILIGEATLEQDRLRLQGISFDIRRTIYKKSQEGGPTDPPTGIFDASKIEGVLFFGNVYVNSGLITNRVQNVVFRLPRPDSLASIKLTEPPKSGISPLMIRRGAN